VTITIPFWPALILALAVMVSAGVQTVQAGAINELLRLYWKLEAERDTPAPASPGEASR